VWRPEQTFACSTTSLCKKGRADVHHTFQADTNPYVDKRRVFDAEAQLDPNNQVHGRDAYPWDPTLDPQIWRTAHPHCGDGKLRDECWDRVGGKGKPPIPVAATMASMQRQIEGSAEKLPRFRHGVRLLRGAQGFRLGQGGLLEAPIGSEGWEAGQGRDRSKGTLDQEPYPIAHYKGKDELKPLGDKTPFNEGQSNANPPLGDHSQWPYAAYEAHESWPRWAARPGSSGSPPKKLDAAMPADYLDWGLGSNAPVLNSGHTAGAPHDSAGDKDRDIDIYHVPVTGAMADKATSTTSTTSLHRSASHSLPTYSDSGPAARVFADRRGDRGRRSARGSVQVVPGGRDDDWKDWVDLALQNV